MTPQEIRTAIRETQEQLAKLPERSPAYAALLDHMRELLKLELSAAKSHAPPTPPPSWMVGEDGKRRRPIIPQPGPGP